MPTHKHRAPTPTHSQLLMCAHLPATHTSLAHVVSQEGRVNTHLLSVCTSEDSDTYPTGISVCKTHMHKHPWLDPLSAF